MSYAEFLNEDAVSSNVLTKPVDPGVTINYADETLEGFRRKLLDTFFEEVSDLTDEIKEKINKCVSTYIYALDKKLKIDEDIINLLAEDLGKNATDVREQLQKLTNEFYDKSKNVIG